MRKILQRISFYWLALALVSVPHLVYVLCHWYAVPLKDGLPVGATDPDVWLRLTLVREWLTSGDWYNHTVPATNAPFGGIISPWTRPLDVVIAGLVHLQPESVSLDLRLMRAALLLPWIWMTLLLAGTLMHVRRVFPLRDAYLLAAGLIAAMPVTWNYFGLGNADHHAPLAAIFIWVLYGVLSPRSSALSLMATGTLLALQLWISFEGLILIGIIYLWYGIQWLYAGNREPLRQLTILAFTVAAGSALALMVERPPTQWLTPVYDSHSIVYVSLLCLTAGLVSLLWIMPQRGTLYARLLFSIFGSAMVLALFFTCYPDALRGPMAEVDPFIIEEFLARISEVRPVYVNPPFQILGTLLQLVAALALCGLSLTSSRYRFFTRSQALAFGYFALMLSALYMNQQRWSYYLYPFLPVILAPFLAAFFQPHDARVSGRWPASWLAVMSENQQARIRLPLALLILLGPIALLYANSQIKNTQTIENEQVVTERESCYLAARQLMRNGELSRLMPPDSIVLAPTDLGAELMFFTKARIIASNYHREGTGIRFIWDANFIEEDAILRKHLAQRSVQYILACPALEHADKSILEEIEKGDRLPTWLKPIRIALPEKSQPFTLHRVAGGLRERE